MYMLLSVVQLITEMIPISSAIHVTLAMLLAQAAGINCAPLPHDYDELLHLSPLLIIAWYFASSWIPLVRGFLAYAFVRPTSHSRYLQRWVGWHLITLTLVSAAVTGASYGLKKIFFSAYSRPDWALVIGLSLTSLMLLMHYEHRWKTYGVWLVNLVKRPTTGLFGVRGYNPVSLGLLLGAAQGLALLVGSSRFAGTVTIALLCGLKPQRALAASWMVFAPLMLGSVLLHGIPWLFAGGWALIATPYHLGAVLLSFLFAAFIFTHVARMLYAHLWWLLGVYLFVPITMLIGFMLY